MASPSRSRPHAPSFASRPGRLLAVLVAPLVLATAIGLVVLWPNAPESAPGEAIGRPEIVTGAVVATRTGACPGAPPGQGGECHSATIRLLEGPEAGREVPVDLPLRAEPGTRVELSRLAGGGGGAGGGAASYGFADFDRRAPLVVLGGLFAAAVLLLGRLQGVRAMVGTALSLVVLVVFVLPAVLDGSPPLAVALVGSATIAIVVLYLTHGVTVATTTALVGTLLSLAVVGILGTVFVRAGALTGLSSDEATFLQAFSGRVDLRGLLLGGIVIGALGVLDDVTVTQVSAVGELHRANPGYGRRDLYRSALRIGRDHIASTVNTLVLAYAGASLPLFVLFTQLDQGIAEVVTSEVVASEVVRALVGSIGLVLSVPLTTALAALVVTADSS